MKEAFTIFDIPALTEAVKSSSLSCDCVTEFLNRFAFECIYRTDDKSTVYCAGDANNTEIEVLGAHFPEVSVLYWENGKPFTLYI